MGINKCTEIGEESGLYSPSLSLPPSSRTRTCVFNKTWIVKVTRDPQLQKANKQIYVSVTQKCRFPWLTGRLNSVFDTHFNSQTFSYAKRKSVRYTGSSPCRTLKPLQCRTKMPGNKYSTLGKSGKKCASGVSIPCCCILHWKKFPNKVQKQPHVGCIVLIKSRCDQNMD